MIIIRFLAVCTLCLFLGGCLVTEQDLVMQRDILEMKRRLDEAERAVKELEADASGGVRARVDTLATNQADFQAGLDGLRVDVQSMQGRFDDQERMRDDLRQEMTLLRDDLGLQLADLEQRMGQLEETPEPTVDMAPPATPTTPVTTPEPVAVAPVTESTPEPVVEATPTPVGESAAELYDRGLKTIREEQQFAAGREVLETFLKRYPADPLAVNAAYWVGETFYAEKIYDKAILQFEEVIQSYGDHPKVASSQLKQGLAFDALGDRENAKVLLQRVIDRFPLSEEAKLSKEKLAEWGN